MLLTRVAEVTRSYISIPALAMATAAQLMAAESAGRRKREKVRELIVATIPALFYIDWPGSYIIIYN